MRRKLGDAQADGVRSREELTNFLRSVNSVLNDVEDAPDAMGDLVKNEVRLLDACVTHATDQSLASFQEQLQAVARGDSSPVCLPDDDSPESRLVFRK